MRGPRDELLDGFWGLEFPGRCGPLDEERVRLVDKQYPGGVFPVRVGMYFDEKSWDGSDFFMSDDTTAHVFATERVVDVLSALKLLGVSFERATEVERLPHP